MKKFYDLVFWISKFIAFLIVVFGLYVYLHCDITWYVFAIGFLFIIALMLAFAGIIPGKKKIDKSGEFIALLGASIIPFWVEPLSYRLYIWAILITFSYLRFAALKNHDRANVPRNEHIRTYIHFIMIFSFVYYAVKTDGLTRWLNISGALTAAILCGYIGMYVEQVKNYDRQEDNYNVSNFKRIHKKSFDEVLNDKGLIGEYLVADWLRNINTYHKILYNVYTPSYKKRYVSEIDAVVITRQGIDVIEVKNQNKYWKINGEGKKDAIAFNQNFEVIQEDVNNPFHQNHIHKENLQHLLKNGPIEIVKKSSTNVGRYVVFGPNTIGWKIKNVKQGYCSYEYISDLVNNSCKKYNILSESEIDLIYLFLREYENNEKLSNEHRAKLGY